MNIVFKWQTNRVSNAAAYSLLQLWRCPAMKLPIQVKPLLFYWVLDPGSSPYAPMSLPLLPSSGQLVVHQCHWGLGGIRHSCKDEVASFCNCKMASKGLSQTLSLEVRVACLSLHTQLCVANVSIALWRAQALTCSMPPSCSYYHLPVPLFSGKEFPWVHCVLNMAKEVLALAPLLSYGV